MRKLVLCGMLIVGYVFADEQEFESWHFGDSITSESRQEAKLESKRNLNGNLHKNLTKHLNGVWL
ncbi:hypothetical protein HW260_03315 [Helicobacter cinaedi]|uniref:Uncharacterized protein n=1 Tax=Helicobacter cinaedi CCUG 18818 = ATCC BAA-847 TaxID=537971 RepID=A0AAI8QHA6_9HELI|nr:hypothetical protein [Helicobacter cinaedi]AWK61461.1 hypothetical protein C6B36_03220 [Helicobacter cinaedi]EFR47556.1 hypothetical protein HCCG_02104 [Helicobacter cinaedi CCUG 18818 = ATCC BAA-847]QOQ91378.1 hypothetical protein HW260_03315 [Helicobacter cinaedi]QOQ95566.1 hypothetical protein HW245_08020 [Helicobacter cinaedi]BAM32610.1 hypothetical protein HCBAA847_1380 [Helicobacter cinaedi CCUG 18818 = ATCC BAA-847]